MGAFFVYILKSAFCLAFFYLFYRLLLSKETFHRFNRIALLGILMLSILIPLIQITTETHTEVQQTVLTLEMLLLMADAQTASATVDVPAISGIQMALLVYMAGILFFFFRNLYSLVRMLLLLRGGHTERMEDGVRLVVHNKDIAPFSWLRYIVISEKDLEENGREILIHERAHIGHRHSLDLLLADVCIFFQWFNPASWLLKQELQNIHEYQADETVIQQGVDAKQYQLLLIKKAVGTRLYSMANSFNHSKLKKRITMMLKEKSSPWARLKYLYVLPLAAITVSVFARPEVSNKVEEISAVKVNDLTAIVETKVAESVAPLVVDTAKRVKKASVAEPAIVMPDEYPSFPGGMTEMMTFISRSIKYPKSAQEAGIQGRVVLQVMITADGKVTSPNVVRKVDSALDEEAVRVAMSMPNWIPAVENGKNVECKMTFPITFKLHGKEEPTSDSFGGKKPVVVVDGQVVTREVFQAIMPTRIKSIDVLKGESATNLYGEKGADGAILITLLTDEEFNAKEVKKASGDISFKGNKDGQVVAVMKDKAGDLSMAADEIVVVGYQGDAIQVTGKVTDKKGNAVVGATVLIEGTTTGTITDTKGVFQLKAAKDATLKVSYIGVKTGTVKVSSSPLVIALEDE